MPTAVLIVLSDEGQMMIGELDTEENPIPMEELQPVATFEEAMTTAETLLLGEAAPPEIEEDAFNAAVGTPPKDRMMEEA